MKDWIDSHVPHVVVGYIALVIGYFEPVKNIVHLVVLMSLIDFIFGIWAAKRNSVAIVSRRMWRTIDKIFKEVVIVLAVYCVDIEIGYIALHKSVAWFIVGVEFWSIIETLSKTSDHRVFRLIKKMMQMKIKEKTGIDIEENGQ